jgi:hypothetical protein
MKHIIYKELIHFQKFIFTQKYQKKKCHPPKQLYAFFIIIFKNNYSKIQLYEKVCFGKKDMQSFSKVTSLVRFISFMPP